MASISLTIKFIRVGVGISNTDVEYADSTSNKTAPTSGWQTNAPAWQNGHYIWTRTRIYYTDGNEKITDPVCLPSGKGIAKIEEWYYQSSSATTLTGGSWVKDKAPTWRDGWYVWTKSIITYTDGSTTSTDPVCSTGGKGSKGDKGDGMVVAYQQAASKPANKPLVTSYETYKTADNLQNNWFKSAPSAQRVLVSGGSVPNVSYNENWSIGEWVATSNSGHTWYKSPEVNHSALSQMRIDFTTTVDDQYVTFYLKAYSEENYDFILISEIDSEKISKSDYTERASGNGVEVRARLKCNKAGAHFVCVAYAKDSSGVANGDYGLVRMATNENYVYADTMLYRCDGDVKDGVISWGSIYQAQGDKGDKGDKGDRGEQGEKGKYMRGPQDWDSLSDGFTFYPLNNQEVAFFDVIEYGGKYYECNKKHVKNSSTTPLADYETNKGSGNWKLSVQFSMVAAKVLWSLIGQIEFFGSQRIIVGSSKTNQRVVIEDGLLKMFGLVNKTQPNIVFGTDETGASVLSYYGNDGKFLYNLGPSGLDAEGMTSSSFDEVVVAKVSDVAGKTAFSSLRKFGNGKYYEACSDYNVQENLFGTSAISESSGADQSGYQPVKDKILIRNTLYRYTAARIGNTYASDSAKGLTSAELAGKANGKFFTSKTELAKNGQLTNLASGEYIKESEMVLLNLIEMGATGRQPKYRLRIYKYEQGISTGRYIYSIVDMESGWNSSIIN